MSINQSPIQTIPRRPVLHPHRTNARSIVRERRHRSAIRVPPLRVRIGVEIPALWPGFDGPRSRGGRVGRHRVPPVKRGDDEWLHPPSDSTSRSEGRRGSPLRFRRSRGTPKEVLNTDPQRPCCPFQFIPSSHFRNPAVRTRGDRVRRTRRKGIMGERGAGPRIDRVGRSGCSGTAGGDVGVRQFRESTRQHRTGRHWIRVAYSRRCREYRSKGTRYRGHRWRPLHGRRLFRRRPQETRWEGHPLERTTARRRDPRPILRLREDIRVDMQRRG